MNTITIGPGDTIDFAVGTGGNGYLDDGTGLAARIILATPDIAAESLTFNTAQDGVDFSYTVTGADLPQDTTAALYWAKGTTFADVIGGPVYSTSIERAQGEYGPIAVPKSALGTPPQGATYLLLVTDPANIIAESDEGNNVAAVPIPVSPVSPKIDIRPGNPINPINSKSEGTVLVAILSQPGFDAPTEVDRTSLTFGRTGDEASLAFVNAQAVDVNGDGLLDLLCHFKVQAGGFQAGDTEGVLKGMTLDGTAFQATDSVRIVPGALHPSAAGVPDHAGQANSRNAKDTLFAALGQESDLLALAEVVSAPPLSLPATGRGGRK